MSLGHQVEDVGEEGGRMHLPLVFLLLGVRSGPVSQFDVKVQ
jgi:hypothetical protein